VLAAWGVGTRGRVARVYMSNLHRGRELITEALTVFLSA
jgi:hypothetical protein